MFGVGTLLYIVLFSINGLAVLSEDRFLNRIGWGASSSTPGSQLFQQFSSSQQSEVSVKGRLINLIGAVRTLLRIPLICVNVVVIIYELVLG